jgi:ABC-type multidrug transport system ATPase subunit
MGRFHEQSKCPILISSPLVSSVHGRVEIFNNEYYYIDCDNTNGTYLNNDLIVRQLGSVSKPVKLKDGDILSIGNVMNSERISIIFSLTSNDNFVWEKILLNNNRTVSIGRDSKNDICIPNVTVSRNHAVIKKTGDTAHVFDNNSSNGTIVNGNLIKECVLKNQYIINIGASKIFYINDSLIYRKNIVKLPEKNVSNNKSVTFEHTDAPINTTMGFDVDIKNISRIVSCKNGTGINGGNKKYILQDVSLSINAGELVAICGGSGAGKTTFMNCVNGFEPATSGQVLVNGMDLYKNYSALKNNIGYVPQQDIIHDDLTLESMLTYTAKLRLQKDVTKSEIQKRVTEALKMVDLESQRHTYIKKLSGGQRKRGSIAVELISDPSLFFLDEPTSGLDPEAETHLMHQLRNLSRNKGKTVIVITHTLQNIHLFDKIIFLAPGGKLCFYGTPEMAKKFFGVSNLSDAYEIISKDVEGIVKKYDKYRRAF